MFYLCKDSDGLVRLHTSKPIKGVLYWLSDNYAIEINHDFPDIHWEDSEPKQITKIEYE